MFHESILIFGLSAPLEKVYTKCGRRAMPTMMMGSDALFLECDECWKLLLITKKGSLYLWDLFSRSCLLQDTLASLFAADPMAPLHNAGKHMISSRARTHIHVEGPNFFVWYL